ncbi:unnamed protein product (mitochondrion) [Plasmodiophora brassicae]|uniref:Uncharacterized protein n=1 Tax=Plasmodiophora brassicae TaxID=37360 RepID=A0A3P3YEC9_PLABS|nr:unnamed protein product [Plasmodiophora brassicae]
MPELELRAADADCARVCATGQRSDPDRRARPGHSGYTRSGAAMAWKMAAVVCLVSALVLSANANRWPGSHEWRIISGCAESLRKCTEAIVDETQNTVVPEGRYPFIVKQMKQALTKFLHRETVVNDINTLAKLAACLKPFWTGSTSARKFFAGRNVNKKLRIHIRENIVNAVGEILNPGASTTAFGGIRHVVSMSASRNLGVNDTTKADAGLQLARGDDSKQGALEDPISDLSMVHHQEAPLAHSSANAVPVVSANRSALCHQPGGSNPPVDAQLSEEDVHEVPEGGSGTEHGAPDEDPISCVNSVREETTLALASQPMDPPTPLASGVDPAAIGQTTKAQDDQTKGNIAIGDTDALLVVRQAPWGVDRGCVLNEATRKAQAFEKPALALDGQVQTLLLGEHRNRSSLQACQQGLTSMQTQIGDARNDSHTADVSRRVYQVLGAGLLASIIIGYGVGFRAAPGKDAPVSSGQPKRPSGIVSTVSTAIAGGIALKAFQSVAALEASKSSTSAVMHSAADRPARNSSTVYILASVSATLIILTVVLLVRFKRRLRELQLISVNYADCIECHHI